MRPSNNNSAPAPYPEALIVSSQRRLLVQFMLFALVGAIGTVAHYTVLVALVGLAGAGPVAATTAGFIVGALVNYWLNQRFTFPGRKRHRDTMPKFMTVAVIGLAMNSLTVAWLTATWHVHYLLAQVIATALVLCWNFAANRVWTFPEKSHESPGDARRKRQAI